MREIDLSLVTKTIRDLFIDANKVLPSCVENAMRDARDSEDNPLAKEILGDLVENFELAKKLSLPVCQDTGMAVVFMEVGQDVHFVGGNLEEAVNLGVHQAYVEGLLRCSVVPDPLRRVNSEDNTPAIIHIRLVPGDQVKIMAAPKGFGSENMSAIKMLTPAAKEQDIIDFVAETVEKAGGNPCPPIIVGVGLGGNFERCAFLAKKALCRDLNERHPDPLYRELEEKLLARVNALNVGPQGFGGKTTALAVNVEFDGTHIAGLPVAVNIGCHVTRHKSAVL